ncbi:MAG: IS1182 family transposase [Planctomycetota bacterium]
MPVRPYDQNQQFLLPHNLNEWLRKDHPARVFSDIVDHIDISEFQEIKLEGRPRFDTRMMLKVLLWGYANGVRASRKLEERLLADVTYMWLAGLEKPDFRTICLFRKTNLDRLTYLFGQVLLLAGDLKLVRLGLIALDGTKVRANVSVESFKSIKNWEDELNEAREKVKKILSEAEAADLEDDRKYGENLRGDKIPKELENNQERIKKIEELIKQQTGRKIDKSQKASSTEPEAKFMHHKNGSMPAYNCELAVTKEQIIVHSDVTSEPMDTNQLKPALDAVYDNCGKDPKRVLADAGFRSGANFRELEDRKIDGYIPESSEENIGQDLKPETDLYAKDKFQYNEESNCYKCPAGEILTPTRRSHQYTKYSNKWITVYQAEEGVCLICQQRNKCTKSKNRSIMRGEFEAERLRMLQKLKTDKGRKFYRKRKTMVEPVIGQIKTVGNFIRFMLRGLLGAKIEWKWATIAHNLLKITRKVVSGERKLATVTA